LRRRVKVKKITILVLLLAMLPTLACEFGFNLGGAEARVEQGVPCRDVTDDYEPIDPTTVFSTTDDLYVSVQYFNLEEGQEITFVWFQGENSLDELTLAIDVSTAGSEGYAAAWFTNQGSPWPVGDYHVDVYLDGELDHTVDFHVE
jgi:hypothetical protein